MKDAGKWVMVAAAMLIAQSLSACTSIGVGKSDKPYKADWESLAQHPTPEWFKDAKFGIYTHWGVYSVPAFGNEWYPRKMYQNRELRRGNYFEFHEENFGPHEEFGYHNFVPLFKAEKFDAEEWAELFRKAGAKFAGPVAEHHDGFAMWDSDLTTWNAADRGPHKDIVGELERAVRKRGMKFVTSFHHARKWWYYEVSYTPEDEYHTRDARYAGPYGLYPPAHDEGDPPTPGYMEAWKAKLVEVVDKYQPDLMWFDGGLMKEKFWRSSADEFDQYKRDYLAYYYNKAREWGKQVGVTYKHEDLPEGAGILDIERGRMSELSEEAWLTDTAVGRNSWSHVRNLEYKTVDELVHVLVDIVSKNGNLLLNVGPKADGTIPEMDRRLLLGIGKWLDVNGEAIYGTRPWKRYGEGPTEMGTTGSFSEKQEVAYTAEDIRFTTKGDVLYAICLGWPADRVQIKSLGTDAGLCGREIASVQLLGIQGALNWKRTGEALIIQSPGRKPCENAYVFKISLR